LAERPKSSRTEIRDVPPFQRVDRASEGRCSSAELSGQDVIDELCVARAQSGPALAVDNERGEHTGRELLLELRQVSTLRSEHKREVV
jgi:hypothetical protein